MCRIVEFIPGREKEVHALIKRVFDKFVGCDYSEKGVQTFYDFIGPEKIRSRYTEGNIILLCEVGPSLSGIIEAKGNNHICLFFVDHQYHKRGIGRKLLETLLERVKEKTDFLEVNASPYSEKIYKKLGFRTIEDLQEIDGIQFIPMKLKIS